MKILIIGDCHLKVNNLLAGRKLLSWLKEINVQYRPELIVNLGDFFNDHAVLRAEILSEYGKHISDMCGADHRPYYVHI
jgi:metallophosphoesterase superfamily enzyme